MSRLKYYHWGVATATADIARLFEEMYAKTKSDLIKFVNHSEDLMQAAMRPADYLKPLLERAAGTTANNDV